MWDWGWRTIAAAAAIIATTSVDVFAKRTGSLRVSALLLPVGTISSSCQRSTSPFSARRLQRRPTQLTAQARASMSSAPRALKLYLHVDRLFSLSCMVGFIGLDLAPLGTCWSSAW